MRKVIVFAKETETIENIQKMLEDQNVNYAVIGGGHKRIQEIIDEFRDNPEQRVLLLQSERYASGINLQFATDLVFYHRLHDSAIEKQAIGRIQRFGRKCSGRVWYLLYAAEE